MIPVFNKRGVNIWSLDNKIGTLTHPDKFRQLIQRAQDYSSELSRKIKWAVKVKGLQDCAAIEPTVAGDGWSALEDARLLDFIDKDKIPKKYMSFQQEKRIRVK
jgi:hypothetical protein